MWFLQTSVDAIALPTDSVGQIALTGNVTPWHHLVREHTFGTDERAAISEMPLRWSIWSWQQAGRRVLLHDTVAMHEPLAEMVRAEPMRACIFTRYPLPGKRLGDKTLEMIVVVPPEHFARYESLIRFAMTLPTGHVSMSVRSPAAYHGEEETQGTRQLVVPGQVSVAEGLEMVVARSKPEKLAKTDLRNERRTSPMMHSPANLIYDDGDDWLLFAAQPEATNSLEDSIL